MTLDVASRLAVGQSSVANTAAYVAACHAVGYQHPDLTAHAAQIFEWYGRDDGLDLAVLDADCVALRAASAAADQAVRVSRDGLAAMAVAWDGESGSAADEFIRRHCAAGAAVADSLRAAAQSCEALRDRLSRAVDDKVGAVVSIDDRRAGERPAWLTAAATVVGGGAAREQAIDVVAHQITPYVDADIRTDWLRAMRAATSSATAAYEDAVRQLDLVPTTHFEVPGVFGGPPPGSAPPASPRTAPAAAVPVVPPEALPVSPSVGESGPPAPSAFSPPADIPAAQSLPAQPLPTQLPVEAPAPSAPGIPASAAMPSMPDVGGGLSSLVGQIADALGGLLDGMPENAVDDVPPGLDGPDTEDDPAAQGDPEDLASVNEAGPEDDSTVEESESAGQPAEVPPTAAAVEAGQAEPSSQPEAPAPEAPAPPVVEESGDKTPCEIAADELPQVGQ
ncbi:hypothetical protein Y900_007560 [Mycolicibacterium aromaticivorans JS19b1 = JCM 16368]|uniref:Alanine and proline rich protein n=1 Tax=Mycolicibacterium aromaticivorans JS19b1 = JCM 16368 TaxID=1440774 RepID=A0A064CJ73_9MYCO|nr:hypothetical protein [Mycolicibacterium aromaticivorans]KDE98807.1 hypothetical protein Y900_007560 [Mycolicibacterium aromaticivorans JS19b1 = JCM 16368]